MQENHFHFYHNRANIMILEIRYLFPETIITFFKAFVNPSKNFWAIHLLCNIRFIIVKIILSYKKAVLPLLFYHFLF